MEIGKLLTDMINLVQMEHGNYYYSYRVYIQNSFEINKNEMIVRINNSLIKLSLKENIYSSFFKNLK